MSPNTIADAVYGWLWWSVFELGRRAGHGVERCYRAAMRAGAGLYRDDDDDAPKKRRT